MFSAGGLEEEILSAKDVEGRLTRTWYKQSIGESTGWPRLVYKKKSVSIPVGRRLVGCHTRSTDQPWREKLERAPHKNKLKEIFRVGDAGARTATINTCFRATNLSSSQHREAGRTKLACNFFSSWLYKNICV